MDDTGSYIIMRRDHAVKAMHIIAWLAGMLAAAGPSWRRQVQDLYIAHDEIQRAIEMSRNNTLKARETNAS